MFLSGHSYDITYKKTTSHANADTLSRLPLKVTDHEEADEVNVFYNSQFDALPVTCEQVRNATQRDLTLSQVLDFIMSGVFPSEADGNVKALYQTEGRTDRASRMHYVGKMCRYSGITTRMCYG